MVDVTGKEILECPDVSIPMSGLEVWHLVQGGNSRLVKLQEVATHVINLIVAGAPITMDTLNEITNALNDDPDFYNTINNLINNRAPLLLVPEIVAAASYTIQATDKYASKRLTAPGPVEIEVPLNATVAVPIGARIRFTALGDNGAVIVKEDAAIVLNSRDDAFTSGGVGAVFELHKVDEDEWDVLGDVVP